jgi:hypothetical protein
VNTKILRYLGKCTVIYNIKTNNKETDKVEF